MTQKMKLIIITQEDSFAVPQNIEKIIKLDFVTIQKVLNIDSSHSLVNQKKLFIDGFGLLQSAKMGVKVGLHKANDFLDGISSYKTSLPSKSLKAVALKNKIDYQKITNPNDEKFLDELEVLKPDIIVSFSAPLVFKNKLLSIPTLGCINLHCSFLPNFAGIMPSFWTLYKKQKSTGVTVHYMDSKIDNGKILGQKEVLIEKDETIFSLILKTKEIGGEVMCDVLREIHAGKMVPKDNNTENGSYFSWPKVEDFKDFKKQGGRLI